MLWTLTAAAVCLTRQGGDENGDESVALGQCLVEEEGLGSIRALLLGDLHAGSSKGGHRCLVLTVRRTHLSVGNEIICHQQSLWLLSTALSVKRHKKPGQVSHLDCDDEAI